MARGGNVVIPWEAVVRAWVVDRLVVASVLPLLLINVVVIYKPMWRLCTSSCSACVDGLSGCVSVAVLIGLVLFLGNGSM